MGTKGKTAVRVRPEPKPCWGSRGRSPGSSGVWGFLGACNGLKLWIFLLRLSSKPYPGTFMPTGPWWVLATKSRWGIGAINPQEAPRHQGMIYLEIRVCLLTYYQKIKVSTRTPEDLCLLFRILRPRNVTLPPQSCCDMLKANLS